MKFTNMLNRIHDTANLLFVVCPDVIGDALSTGELFEFWRPLLNYPLAFVAQDHQQNLSIPWSHFDCLFIGGTEWKLSEHAARLAEEARIKGKWVHWGRVNSFRRVRYIKSIACDSFDGSSFSMFSETYIPRMLRILESGQRQPFLFGSTE